MQEEVVLTDDENFADAIGHIRQFHDEAYIQKRVHSSLDYLTPAEAESKWR